MPGMGGGGMPGMGGGGMPGMNPAMMQQMANNPQMQQFMQQYAQGQGMGGMGGMPGAGQNQARSTHPVLGEVLSITSLVHLQKIIKDYPGVVIDFWAPTCPPCMRFKPTYESAARGNPNKNIVFCSV